MNQDVLREAEAKMKKCVEATRSALATIFNRRALPAMVEGLRVEAYGASSLLNELATVSVPEPRLIVIQPYDSATAKTIEKAIQNSGLGVTPSYDGRLIRLPMPRPSESLLRERARQTRMRVEDSKIAVRNVRRDSMEDLRNFVSDKLISEEDQRRAQERLMELSDRYLRELDQICAQKEAEILDA